MPTSLSLLPGLMACLLVAAAAQLASAYLHAPAMLIALVLGLLLHPVCSGEKLRTGIQFSSRGLLRIAVALLGVRISYGLLKEISPLFLAAITASVALTIGFGVILARVLQQDRSVGLLSAGATSICGASAAVAICSVLPADPRNEERLSSAVFAVTLLSTLAMVLYPVLLSALGYSDTLAGIVLGATIHDVAQVVGAGLSISQQAGDTATLTKLFRISLLAPVVLAISIWARTQASVDTTTADRPPLVPGFVLAFLALAGLASTGLLPQPLVGLVTEIARWALLAAIAAVGIKTSFRGLWAAGSTVFFMISIETLFLGGLFLGFVAVIT